MEAVLDCESSKLNREYSSVGDDSSERRTLDRAKSGKPGAKVGSTKNLKESVNGEVKNSLAKCIMTQPLKLFFKQFLFNFFLLGIPIGAIPLVKQKRCFKKF